MRLHWPLAVAFLLFSRHSMAQQSCRFAYEQCGGKNFAEPPKPCCEGTYCREIAEFYHQCYPIVEGSPLPSPHPSQQISPQPSPSPSPEAVSPRPMESRFSLGPSPSRSVQSKLQNVAQISAASRDVSASATGSSAGPGNTLNDGRNAYTMVLSPTIVTVTSTWDSNGSPIHFMTSVVAVTQTIAPGSNDQRKDDGLRNAVITGVAVAGTMGLLVMLVLIWIKRRASKKDNFKFGNFRPHNSRGSDGHLVSLEINTKPDVYTANFPEKPELMRYSRMESSSSGSSYNFRSISSNPFSDPFDSVLEHDDSSMYGSVSEPPSAVALNLIMSSSASSKTDSMEYTDANPFGPEAIIPNSPPHELSIPRNHLMMDSRSERSSGVPDRVSRVMSTASKASEATSRSSGTLTPMWQVSKSER